jgi:CRISPR-associated protein Cmr5
MAQTMEQQRAAFAWKVSEQGIAQAQDKYTKLAKGTPALIMNSGLMQTLAFLNDKAEVQHQQLLQHLLLWLAQRFDGETTLHAQHPFPRAVARPTFEATMQALFHARPEQFQRATSETMMVLRWIRQLAAARGA